MKIEEIKIGDLILERGSKLIGVIVEKKRIHIGPPDARDNVIVLVHWNSQINGINQTWEAASQISKVGDLLEVTVIPF